MDAIGVFNPEQANALWQDFLHRQQQQPGTSHNSRRGKPVFEPGGRLCVILDAALAKATNSKTGATSCLATVCYWSVITERYTESVPVRQVKVWNHSETTAHAINTFGWARWIDAHFWFFGDCAAMAAR